MQMINTYSVDFYKSAGGYHTMYITGTIQQVRKYVIKENKAYGTVSSHPYLKQVPKTLKKNESKINLTL